MSLEVALQETTAAIRELIAAIARGTVTPAATEKVVAAPVGPKVEAKQEATAVSAAEVSYQDAAKSITQLSRAKGRDVALKVLQSFGVDNLKGVRPEQFADVIAAAQQALEA